MTQPVQDKETVTPAGERLDQLPAGVTFHDVTTNDPIRRPAAWCRRSC